MFAVPDACSVLLDGRRDEAVDRAELEAAVVAFGDRVVSEAPSLGAPDLAFVAHVRGHLGDDPVVAFLREVHAGELYIAFRSAHGERRAIELFEPQCFGDIALAKSRVRLDVPADEIAQQLREKLFVAQDGEPGRAAQYSGRGSLRAWFRVIAVRHCLNLATRGVERREVSFDAGALAMAGGLDPELLQLRARAAERIDEAFRQGAARLSREERRLLRYATCDGLGIDALAQLFGVHRATAARRLAAARERLATNVREIIGEQGSIEGSNLAGLL